MTDPAVEAAHRALITDGSSAKPWLAEAAAREALLPIRELHKPEWSNCLNHCCSGEGCKHRTRICAAGCDEWVNDNYDLWPCATSYLVYTESELKT